MITRRPPPDAMSAGVMVRTLASLLTRGEWIGTLCYIALSLGVALSGSVAALLLVPLVQPSLLGRGLFSMGGTDAQAIAFSVATVAFALMRWQSARLGAWLVGSLARTLRQRVHARLMGAPMASLANSPSAEIANVLTYNIEIIVPGYGALQQLLVAALTSVVTLAFAIWISPWLVLAVPVLVVAGVLVSRSFGREQSLVSRRYVRDLTDLFWHSEDFPRRLRHVRSFERESAEEASHHAVSCRLAQGYGRQLELIASSRLVLELMAALGVGAVFMLAHRWQGIDQGSLVAVCLLLVRLLPSLLLTRQSFQQWRSAVPAFELWQKYMQLGTTETAAPPLQVRGEVEVIYIDRVRVTPPAAGLTLLDIELKPGELTLISGRSGIGKTSLVDVLAGMAEPEVFLAHDRFGPIGLDDYRAHVRRGAYVGQQVRPWQRTVRECLLWAAPGATEQDLGNALRDVGLQMRLDASTDGWDTALDNASSRFSGGELQRLMLAQVILRKPRLAILDEATSALDTPSELSVLKAVKQRLPDTIVLVVSHRAGVADIADQHISIEDSLVQRSATHFAAAGRL
ncbi:ABC transporter ATP-binding protein [Pinirhizobacter sp.]|jgi:ATP-binding cassette subfamily C protein|uniref:ABC transporter ATP-binding protein n=1 Tax=Pinirhizobacter sp. TaxID=2950432 RepID=UPI002F424189